ncbi:MAG: hypothetical protein ACRD4I_15315, partial [Candidatus Angelobacter sp.]
MAASGSSSRYFPLAKLGVNLVAVLALVLLITAAPIPEEKQISIYSNVANYSLPVTAENGHDYV